MSRAPKSAPQMGIKKPQPRCVTAVFCRPMGLATVCVAGNDPARVSYHEASRKSSPLRALLAARRDTIRKQGRRCNRFVTVPPVDVRKPAPGGVRAAVDPRPAEARADRAEPDAISVRRSGSRSRRARRPTDDGPAGTRATEAAHASPSPPQRTAGLWPAILIFRCLLSCND